MFQAGKEQFQRNTSRGLSCGAMASLLCVKHDGLNHLVSFKNSDNEVVPYATFISSCSTQLKCAKAMLSLSFTHSEFRELTVICDESWLAAVLDLTSQREQWLKSGQQTSQPSPFFVLVHVDQFGRLPSPHASSNSSSRSGVSANASADGSAENTPKSGKRKRSASAPTPATTDPRTIDEVKVRDSTLKQKIQKKKKKKEKQREVKL